MKIRMEIDENITEDELVIRCGSLSDDVIILQKQIIEAMNTKIATSCDETKVRVSADTW